MVDALNICLVSREYPPDTAWGGIGTYTYNLARGLVNAGQNVHVIAQSLDGNREYADNGIHVHRLAHKSLFPFKGALREFALRWEYSRCVYTKLREIIQRCNIHVVEAPNLSGEGFIYSLRKIVPLVTRLHTGFSDVVRFLNIRPTLDQQLSCWFESAAIVRSDLITCSTHAHAQKIVSQLGIAEERVRIIPLGTEVPHRVEEKKDATDPMVLFVGRLEKRKGVDILIQAIPEVLRHVPSAQFVLIGRDSFVHNGTVSFSGPKEHSFQDRLLNMLPRDCKPQVRFLGYLSTDELRRFYQACDVFVAPSLYESFGLIYIEAMSYAKPVIGCAVGGVPEVVKDGITGILVPPAQPQALAIALTDLLRNPKRRWQLGTAAQDSVRKNFSIEAMTENTLCAYRHICTSGITYF